MRTITPLDDLPENCILQCTVTTQADVIVTGDQHLLQLKELEGLATVQVADCLRMIRCLARTDVGVRARSTASHCLARLHDGGHPESRVVIDGPWEELEF